MKPFSYDDAKRVWETMTAIYSATIVDKANAPEMRMIARILGLAGFVDPNVFLARYATTIDRRIYLPYVPGQDASGWPPWAQIRNCAHEMMHVLQSESDWYAVRYLTDTHFRAHIECEAWATAYELDAWAGFESYSPAEYAARLRSYGCGDHDVQYAKERLTEVREQVGRLDLTTAEGRLHLRRPSQDIIRILEGEHNEAQ